MTGPFQLSFSSDGREASDVVAGKIAAGEAAGASAFWCANHLFQRDPISLCALALARTASLRVTLMAVNPYTIHPVQAVMAAATLDEWFPGRVSLCFGVGAPADLRSVGVEPSKPLRIMRETFGIARALLAGDTVQHDGETFRIHERRLATGASSIPLFLAASGPQMLQLAGAVADGVLISAGTSVEFVRWSLDQVRAGAAGRAVRASALVYVALAQAEAAAHDRLRRTLAQLLRGAHHGQNLALGGSVLDQARLDAALLRDDWAEAEALVHDDIVRRHAASGEAHQVAQRLADYHAAGLDEVVVAGVRDPDEISRILRSVRSQQDFREQ